MGLLNERVKLVGVDVFVVQKDLPIVEENIGKFKLTIISNRGTKIWPGPQPRIELTDVFRCRYRPHSTAQKTVAHADVLELLGLLEKRGFEWVHIEKLLEINGTPGFALAQGE